MTRGIDIPGLSHVFVYSSPHRVNSQAVDSYLHIAGRVGRFGRGGKVVTFIEDTATEGGQKKNGEVELMLRVLETINVGPAKFVAFD